MRKTFFVYSVFFQQVPQGTVAAQSFTVDIPLDGDADFELLGITTFTDAAISLPPAPPVGIAARTEYTVLDYVYALNALNKTTGRKLFAAPMLLPMIAGFGERPYWLPFPSYWPARSLLSSTLTWPIPAIGNPVSKNIRINYIGAKCYA